MGGGDFYRVVKEKRPSLTDRIIFLTGDTLGDETRTFIDSVTNPLIEKPFQLSELNEGITKVVYRKGSSPLPGQAGAKDEVRILEGTQNER
jgi:DNA-binding response OmpR family regulator